MASMSFAQPRRFILVSGMALAVAALAGGCGQKGALYLPDSPAAAQFPPVTSVMQGIAQAYDADAIAAMVKKNLKGVKLAA